MNKTLQRLQEIEKNGYQIDFGNIFNNAFENYKKIAVYAGLLIFVITCFFFSFFFITFKNYFDSVGLENFNNQLTENLIHQKSLDESIVSILFSILILSLLMTPFFAGFYKMAQHAEKDSEFKLRYMFTFYKAPYFFNIIAATILNAIISMFISTLVLTILSLIHINQNGIILLANYSVSFFVYLFTFLATPLIIFGNLNAVNAIKHSFLIAFKQPLILTGLLIVSLIGSFVGIMGCCIGIFFTLPFLFSTNYAIYSGIVAIDIPEDIQQQE